MAEQAAQIKPIMLRMAQVVQLTGFSERTSWRMAADGRFPKPHNFGGRVQYWLREEVEAFIHDQFAKRKSA